MWMDNLEFNKIQFKAKGKKAKAPPKGCKTTQSLAICVRHFLKEDLETKIEDLDTEGNIRKTLNIARKHEQQIVQPTRTHGPAQHHPVAEGGRSECWWRAQKLKEAS